MIEKMFLERPKLSTECQQIVGTISSSGERSEPGAREASQERARSETSGPEHKLPGHCAVTLGTLGSWWDHFGIFFGSL